MLFDAHTHIQFPAYDDDRDAVISRAREAGVKMITVGTQLSTSRAGIALAKQYPEDIWATVGYHPNHADLNWHHDKNEQADSNPETFDVDVFNKLADEEKVVAI